MERRQFLKSSAAGVAAASLAGNTLGEDSALSPAIDSNQLDAEPKNRTFNVWVAGDQHVTVDTLYGVESLKLAIRQSEGFWDFLPKDEAKLAGIPPSFDWDLMVNVGDFTSSQYPPRDGEGVVLVDQLRALAKHYREDIYSLAGNHDAGYYDEGPGAWFQKWVDPMGENTEFSGIDSKRRRFPVEGTWEAYKFEAGNVLFLILSDINDAPSPIGRGHSKEQSPGGFPAGTVTRKTFEWWKKQVLDNQDKIIISAHHHVLQGTTTISTPNGGAGIHANNTGDFEGASYLYYTIENDDPDDFKYTRSTPDNPGPFEEFLARFEKEHGKPAIDLWFGGHSHATPGETFEGRGTVEQRWGVTFVQVAALTHFHSGRVPMSRLLRFEEGSSDMAIDMYIHRAPYYNHIPKKMMESKGVDAVGLEAPEGGIEKNGWHDSEARTISLRHAFSAPPTDPREKPETR